MKTLGLKWEDFEEKFQKGGGKGGQKVNKSSNSVWLRHPASGLEVKVHKFRELWGNRLSAYRLLVAKIEEQKLGALSPAARRRQKLIKQKKRRGRRSSSGKRTVDGAAGAGMEGKDSVVSPEDRGGSLPSIDG